MLTTYRDPVSGKIITETGEHIASLPDYQKRVASGEVSGKPLDMSQYVAKTGVGGNSNQNSLITNPDIKRNPDGSVSTLKNPLTELGGNVGFIEAAREILKKTQNYNKDLTKSRTYWETLKQDTSPFGGLRDKATQVEGMFTNEQFRQMSPEDQASVRASRGAVINANLGAIADEEKNRGLQIDNVLKVLKDSLDETDKKKTDLIKTKQDQMAFITNYAKLNPNATEAELAKVLASVNIDPEDFFSSSDVTTTTTSKDGSSMSYRHNNPLNIKFAGQANATKGEAATDGGNFAKFDTVEDGLAAARAMLKNTKKYGALSLNQAMKVWSGGVSATPTSVDSTGFDTWLGRRYYNGKGYGSEVLGMSTNASTSSMSDAMLNTLINNMKKAEGWYGPTSTGGTTETTTTGGSATARMLAALQAQDGLEMSDSQKVSLMKDLGLTTKDVEGWDNDMWIVYEGIAKDTAKNYVKIALTTGGTTGELEVPKGKTLIQILTKDGKEPTFEQVQAYIVNHFSKLTATEVGLVLDELGIKRNIPKGVFGQ